ncbi:MAG: hypothetical protein ACTIL0_02265, partial [Microbacterium gubbeenense]
HRGMVIRARGIDTRARMGDGVGHRPAPARFSGLAETQVLVLRSTGFADSAFVSGSARARVKIVA